MCRNVDTLREKELYFSKKKAILEVIYALLNKQIKDRNIIPVTIQDTG